MKTDFFLNCVYYNPAKVFVCNFISVCNEYSVKFYTDIALTLSKVKFPTTEDKSMINNLRGKRKNAHNTDNNRNFKGSSMVPA